LVILNIPTATYLHSARNQSSSPISSLLCSICATMPGTKSIRVHFNDGENPILSIGHSATNNIFSAVVLSSSDENETNKSQTQVALHKHTFHTRPEGHDSRGKCSWLPKHKAWSKTWSIPRRGFAKELLQKNEPGE